MSETNFMNNTDLVDKCNKVKSSNDGVVLLVNFKNVNVFYFNVFDDNDI